MGRSEVTVGTEKCFSFEKSAKMHSNLPDFASRIVAGWNFSLNLVVLDLCRRPVNILFIRGHSSSQFWVHIYVICVYMALWRPGGVVF